MREQGGSQVVQMFLQNMTAMSQSKEFHEGIAVGSLCSGWGVAEMTLQALNEKLETFGRRFPKACNGFGS